MADPRLNPVSLVRPAAATSAAAPTTTPRTAAKGGDFSAALTQAQQAQTLSAQQGVRFSAHAQKRLDKRDIQLGDDGLARLNDAVDRAAQRGGRESLVLMDDMAFIVNVKDRLVVTAMNGTSRKEGVFTQIDSVVLADKK
jgi:flagellar operon protein